MKEKRATTMEQFVDLVQQAVYETEELQASAEYDYEDMGMVLEFVNPLLEELRQLQATLRDGSYTFRDEDLSFMTIVEAQHDAALPFKFLLRMINNTHRMGLAEVGDDA